MLWSGHKEGVGGKCFVDTLILNITCDITTALRAAFPDTQTLCIVECIAVCNVRMAFQKYSQRLLSKNLIEREDG